MKIIKRNGSEAVFDITKIIAAITKANNVVAENQRLTKEQVIDISDKVQKICLERGHAMNVEEIQDLVENAIIHGVRDSADGYIKLYAEKKGHDLLIYVSDNGCGLPPEILNCLNSPDACIIGGHLGLNNVNRILRLYFGDGYGLSATSRPGQGSILCVRLPYKKEEAPHA